MALSFFVRLGTVEALSILERCHTAGAVDLPSLLCVSERFRIVVALGILKQRGLVVALGILVLLPSFSASRLVPRLPDVETGLCKEVATKCEVIYSVDPAGYGPAGTAKICAGSPHLLRAGPQHLSLQ